ncbi:interleukin-12 subunit alpha [Electrophorus electricus]|nr:interleukin-12 subunit alpha [Electrophorus electricus]
MGTPVRTSMDTASVAGAQSCTEHAKTLLTTLKSVLNKDKPTLFHGFKCADLDTEVIPNSSTVAACQPYEDTTCSDQRRSSFNETDCLASMREDLRHYQDKLAEYAESLSKFDAVTELKPILISVRDLQQNCPPLSTNETEKSPTNSPGPVDSFEERMSLCKQLKGFHLRAVTMNRALGYVSAGDYKR